MVAIVLYRLSTSNHNAHLGMLAQLLLSYIVFLHQTTTCKIFICKCITLSYIVFLHQTTTRPPQVRNRHLLSYIVFLHQTTTNLEYELADSDCLISSFYIKPQLALVVREPVHIVLYRLSTSNHNQVLSDIVLIAIVLYRLSTSNHN